MSNWVCGSAKAGLRRDVKPPQPFPTGYTQGCLARQSNRPWTAEPSPKSCVTLPAPHPSPRDPVPHPARKNVRIRILRHRHNPPPPRGRRLHETFRRPAALPHRRSRRRCLPLPSETRPHRPLRHHRRRVANRRDGRHARQCTEILPADRGHFAHGLARGGRRFASCGVEECDGVCAEEGGVAS